MWMIEKRRRCGRYRLCYASGQTDTCVRRKFLLRCYAPEWHLSW
jgi:hypothetical protein